MLASLHTHVLTVDTPSSAAAAAAAQQRRMTSRCGCEAVTMWGCRRVVTMSSSVFVLLLIIAQLCSVAEAAAPLFTDFPADKRHVFNVSSSDYYHSLFVDSSDNNSLLLGAADVIYRLSAGDISTTYRRSGNLSALNAESCWRDTRQQNKGVECRNHIRAAFRVVNSSEYCVCGTGAHSPQEQFLNNALEVVATPAGGDDGSSGSGKCPFDPSVDYVFTYVIEGNPFNVPSMYTAVASSDTGDVRIIRPELHRNRTDTTKLVNLLRTDDDHKWLNTAGPVHVVAVFEHGPYVYYFFRELALEPGPYCDKTYFSRVGRVCKQDQGGTGLDMDYRFTSYLKARLVCSRSSAASSVPHVFNEVYDVQFSASSGLFYALFLANSDGGWGSAVCSFSLDDINHVLDTSDFLEENSDESAWIPAPEDTVPTPRPGQCMSATRDIVSKSLRFIKLHPLLADQIHPSGSQPLYYSKEFSFTKMRVDNVSGYTVLYLYSPDLAEVHQIVLWSNMSGNQFETVSKWRPFVDVVADDVSLPLTVWTMMLHTVRQSSWLYMTTDTAVVQINTELCRLYTKCVDCVRDPHCGWNSNTRQCQQYQDGLTQGVESSDALNVCSGSCSKVYEWSHVIPGMALHLNCSSPCLPNEATVTWSLMLNHTRPAVALPTDNSGDYVLSRDNSLVVVSVNASRHRGTFQCLYNSQLLTQHRVSLSECRYGSWDVWQTEYKNYCRVFDEYYASYNEWKNNANRCR